jgi:hypothetical protein
MYFLLTDKDDSIILGNSPIHNECGDGLLSLYDYLESGISNYYHFEISRIEPYGKKNVLVSPHAPFSCCYYIRSVILVKDCKISYGCNGFVRRMGFFRADKIILGCKYYLGDPQTIKKFNIYIDEKYIANICSIGDVKFLEWWKNSGSPLKYNELALDQASSNGYVEVLEWWVKNNLPLKYTEKSLSQASSNGHVHVLEWWKNSGVKLEYSSGAIDNASWNGHVNVLEWWKNSGLYLLYTESGFKGALYQDRINTVEWWLNSGLKIKVEDDKRIKMLCKLYQKVIAQYENILIN